MMAVKSVDIEQAVSDALSDLGWHAYPPPLPNNFAPYPSVMTTRTGGNRRTRVLDTHRVSIDVRAKTWEAATNAADELTGVLETLAYKDLGGAYCRRVEITTLPYENVDPSHRDIPRVTFAAQISTGVIID